MRPCRPFLTRWAIGSVVDMVGVPTYPNHPKQKADGGMFTYWHPTEFVQVISVADEDHPNMLMDPYTLG